MPEYRLVKKFSSILIAICLLGAAPLTHAIPITGGIGFGGFFTPEDNLGNTVGIGAATSLDFVDGGTWVIGGTGTYDSIWAGTSVDFTDFQFSPVLSPNPVVPLWDLSFFGTNYSFDLSSINVLDQTDWSLRLSGTGTLMADGYDDTAGTWEFLGLSNGDISFTINATQATGGGGTRQVPEPGTIALLGIGLIAIGLVRRRRPS